MHDEVTGSAVDPPQPVQGEAQRLERGVELPSKRSTTLKIEPTITREHGGKEIDGPEEARPRHALMDQERQEHRHGHPDRKRRQHQRGIGNEARKGVVHALSSWRRRPIRRDRSKSLVSERTNPQNSGTIRNTRSSRALAGRQGERASRGGVASGRSGTGHLSGLGPCFALLGNLS